MKRRRWARSARSGAALVALACFGCAADPDPLDAPGVAWSEDEVFRYRDFAGRDPRDVYSVARALLRFRFAGGVVRELPDEGKLETRPRGLARANRRVTLYMQVSGVEGGTRVEVFAPIEEMIDDPRDDPENPWRLVSRDARLENFMLEDVYAALETGNPPPEPREE